MPNRVTKHGVWNQTSYDWDWEGEGERKPTKKVSADKTVEHILRILQEEKDKLDS